MLLVKSYSKQEPEINTEQLREHKNKVVARLTGGLKQLAKQRKVQVVTGYGKFTSANTIEDGKEINGWWNPFIGNGKAVDLDKFQVSTRHIEVMVGVNLWDRLTGSKISKEKVKIRTMWEH